MRKFIIQLFVFSISFFVVEKAFYFFLSIPPRLERDRRLEYVLNGKINKDLIVLGSSRGSRNIIASQIEDSLNISCYNLSYDGSDIEFHEFLLRSLIKHNKKPKIVLLAVDDPSELLPDESIKFRFDRLYPLVKFNYINNELIEKGENTFLSNFLILARINKRNFSIGEKKFSELDSIMKCGSMPISFQRKDRRFVFFNNSNYKVDNELPEKVKAFRDLQNLCVNNNIQLITVYSPNFKEHNILFKKRIKEISHPKVTSILYDSTNQIYKNKDYFYDEAHLKRNGAVIFTNEIIRQLKAML